jgi:cytoskeletal protein CcmA (bactofilin family)
MTTNRLAIEPGSKFTGYCDMSNEPEKKFDKPSLAGSENQEKKS